MEEIYKDRAWIEIDMQNLQNNIEQIKKLISKDCKIMAVVKANAYGHGMINVAKKLSKIGIEDFAVATLSEAIELRKHDIRGNILILGYTNIEDIKYVQKYDLIQTIVDYDYAKKVNEKVNEIVNNGKIKTHIKLNTGMNRIGENCKDIGKIISIFKLNNIDILGMFTHLSSADSLKVEDIDFTNRQINNFFDCIKEIKRLGYNPGKLHIQSSYGILNYSEIKCDYVRPGIIMYGIYCTKEHNAKIEPNLKPVLELKARITSVKYIDKDEAVSYGRTYIAKEKMKIATVSIGYADGYPRNLSGKNAKVYVNGKYATIIGRVCMDQLMIDVSAINDIKEGDVVTLIGAEKEISAEEIATQADTITDELLCRLGQRLPRIEK